WLMMSLWDALRMNMMISYQELVRTFPNLNFIVCWGCEISFQTAKARHLHVCFVTFTSGIIVAVDKYQPFVLPRVNAAKPGIVNK
ncbi:hypothetical protein, partial [Enterobacter hormaechei]|uniref:hypothetical protein n=2 Tax=Enterobacter hormaechei TaxID=158836 RepID=UPI001A9C813C